MVMMAGGILFIADEPSFGFNDANGVVVAPTLPAGTDVPLHDLASRIASVCGQPDAPEILFIDIFIRFKDDDYSEASDLGGIALLKFLRIKGVRQHIVLLSPWSLVELLQIGTGNLIVASQGVTVAPYHFDQTQLDLGSELTKAAEVSVLQGYLKPGIQLAKDERHSWANWWGIDRLWYVNEVVEGRAPGADRLEEETYPGPLRERITELRNQEALFCHGHADKLVHVDLRSMAEVTVALQQELERLEQLVANLMADKKATEDELQQAGSTTPGSEVGATFGLLKILSPGTNPILARLLSDQAKRLLPDLARRRALLDRLREIQEELQLIENRKSDTTRALSGVEDDIEQQLALQQESFELLNALIRETKSAINGVAIHTLRHQLRERQPRILLIDDQANDGWADVMQNVIYGGPSDAFKFIAPPPGRTIDADYYTDSIGPVVADHKPQVILLDLRLSKESGGGHEVDDLSGALVLRQLRKNHPGLPVIMTTASNKAWSLERLIHLGCDGYWIKEGLDLDLPTPASVKNYARFMELVERTTSEPFGNVMRFGQRLKEFAMAEGKYWWEKPTAKPTIRGATRVEVLSILKEGLYLLRDHLAVVELGRVAARPTNDWFYPSLVPMHITRIIEEVYDAYESGAIGKTDKVAESLLKRRNSAAHLVQLAGQDNARSWDQKKLFAWLNEFMDWLSKAPGPPSGPKVIRTIKL